MLKGRNMTFEQVNILGQILDTTFGKSSTAKSPSFSIKTKMSGDNIHVTYTTIVNLVTDRVMRDQVKEEERVSEKLIGDFIDEVKKEFRRVAGSTLKLKKGDSTDEIELISMSPYNPKRTAYYRRRAVFTVNG
jgi:hypothetical protein